MAGLLPSADLFSLEGSPEQTPSRRPGCALTEIAVALSQTADLSASNRSKPLELCEHCDLLGVSSVVHFDAESTDVIHCSICNLSFHFVTEGNKLVVAEVQKRPEEA